MKARDWLLAWSVMVIAACGASVPAATPMAEPPTVSVAAVKPIETATLPPARPALPPTIAVASVPTLPPIIVTNPLPSATPWPTPTPDLTLTALAFDGTATVAAQHTPNYVTGCDVTLPPPTVLDTAAAIQHFETGLMIWLQARNEIWVLIASPTANQFYWRVLPNQWSEGIAEFDPSLTPPSDRVQPVRGFGYAWRIGSGSMAAQRADLGWAIDEELGFTTTLIYYPQGYYSPDCIWQPKSGIYELRDNRGNVFRFVGEGGVANLMVAQP